MTENKRAKYRIIKAFLSYLFLVPHAIILPRMKTPENELIDPENARRIERNRIIGGQEKPPATLQEVFSEEELSPTEMRVVQAADVLQVPFSDRVILFGAHIFFESGIFRARDLLGFSPDRTVAARDKVRTNKRYEDLWGKLEIVREPYFLEIAMLKRKKVHHQEIAGELEIKKTRVDEISKALIAHGVIEPSGRGRAQADKFEALCRRVELIEDPLLSDEKMAEMLDVSQTKIERARARLKSEGKTRARTHSELRRAGRSHNAELRRQVLELYPKHTPRQIAEITGAPYEKVKNQVTVLKRSKALPNAPLEN